MQNNLIVFPEHPSGNNDQLVAPVPLTPLIGRDHQVQAVKALLLRSDVHLLTLTGTPGVGKTRLALEVSRDLARDFTNGISFVSLASLDDPALVVPTIAHHMGIMESSTQPILNLLKMSLRNKQQLLILDNFEQVIEAAPLFVELLEACPALKLLVTSREVLRLRGEYQCVVPPLALPDPKHLPDHGSLAHIPSVNLFLQRAQAIQADFHITTDNAATIAEICLRLDGLPLAIELAAVRIRLLPPPALLTRLNHRLHVLTEGTRDLPLRQQTLRKTLAWSYELLTEQEQHLFGQLSIFVGGCTLEAVEAICSTPGSTSAGVIVPVLDVIASLIDKNLVQQQGQKDGEPRLVLLETIREYGLEVLEASGELEDVRWTHASYYLHLAEEAESQLSGPQQIRWFEQLEREHDNLRAALSRLLEQGLDAQKRDLALRLGGALAQFWEIRGYVSEGRRWLERVLQISRGVRSAARAKALIGTGRIASFQDDFGPAEAWCREGLVLYRELGDQEGCAAALLIWGYVAMMRSTYAAARSLLEEALTLFREMGDQAGRVSGLYLLASVLFFQGDYARAQTLLEESRVGSRERGDIQSHSASLMLLGAVELFQGDFAGARACLEESLTISKGVGYKRNLGLSFLFLAMVSWAQGDASRAHTLLEESQAIFREVGGRGRMAEVFVTQGLVSLGEGDSLAARVQLEESLKIALELDNKWNIA